jgi:23S rRNA (pseudouridine1915-N3)-methyltransferase
MLGKTRRAELRAVLDDYVKRVGRYSAIEVVEVRDESAMLKKLDAERAATVVLLDAAGELRDRGARELIFVCGDADGFPEAVRQRTRQKLSLGAMTFSHELARVMLAEQLYRAFAILSGSPYPK